MHGFHVFTCVGLYLGKNFLSICAGENIEPDKGYWIAHSIQYRGGPGTIDPQNPWLPAAQNPRVNAVNCSVCKGSCYDRDWARTPGQAGGGPGTKCDKVHGGMNETLSKLISPCELGCHCNPPPNSYDYRECTPSKAVGFEIGTSVLNFERSRPGPFHKGRNPPQR